MVKVQLPEMTGDAATDIAALWDALYQLIVSVNAELAAIEDDGR